MRALRAMHCKHVRERVIEEYLAGNGRCFLHQRELLAVSVLVGGSRRTLGRATLLVRALSRSAGADIDSWADIFRTRMAVRPCGHVRPDPMRDADPPSGSFAHGRACVRLLVVNSGGDAVVGRAHVISTDCSQLTQKKPRCRHRAATSATSRGQYAGSFHPISH